MRALCWHGREDIRVDTVPDPRIEDPRDIIVKISSTAICGSDLHIYGGFVPSMEKGDIVGHEPMGEVVEVGRDVKTLRRGDRVVVPFTISCGACFFCRKQMFSLCDTSNPNADAAREAMGQSPAGLLGYSHLFGGFPGGQAEYLRVPFADVGPVKIPPTSFPPATWRRRTRRSSRARRWPSGDAGRSASSPSRARGCSMPGG